MITVIKCVLTGKKATVNEVEYDKATFQFAGLSSDTKPSPIYNNLRIANISSFVEIDTGDISLYDEENSVWNELPDGSAVAVEGIADISTVAETKAYLGF